MMAGALSATAAVQTLEVEYASAADAQAAEVTVSALPEGKRLAFTERWDDSNLRHLDMANAMDPIGVKATFYFNGGRGEKFPPVMRELVRRGHSIGDHTMTHSHQPGLLPFRQFRDIMECRVELECDSQSPVVAYTTPHGVYKMATDDEARVRLGRSLLNAGILSSPEGNQQVCETYSLSPREWFGSHYFWANDKEPNLKTYTDGLCAATNAMLASNSPFGPHVTLGTHTQQSDEGLLRLREMLTPLSRLPDVWFVNENQWVAARRLQYDARITRRQICGRHVTYLVERPDARDLGAETGPFFRFSRPPRNWRLSPLPVAAQVPVAYRRLAEGALKVDSSLRNFTLELTNDTAAAWPSVRVILRLPSVYRPGTVTVDVGALAAGERRVVTLNAEPSGWDRLFEGDFYAAAQIDYVNALRPERRWAEVRVKRPSEKQRLPRDTVVSVGPIALDDCPDNEYFCELSKSETELKPLAGEAWQASRGLGVFNPRYVTMAWPKRMPKSPKGCPAVWVCDFDADTAAHGTDWLLSGRIYGWPTRRELFLNGERLGEFGMTDVERPLKLKPGRNRLVCKFKYIASESLNHEIMIVSRQDRTEVVYRDASLGEKH